MIPRIPALFFLGALALARAAETKQADARPDPKAAPGGRDLSYNSVATGPRPAEEERRSFKLPPGFEIELVAAESEGIGKFITVAWDARMRLWSMTALEYPVDGNEHKAASDALFARGGRDKVVVFDKPYGTPAPGAAAVTSPPRIFADGLVMPLGVLPYGDGAFVQYGSDIRLYHDANADGRADRFDTILTGFGTQDSHLFPHQFTRQPGGTIFLAQGLFNFSKVRRPEGKPFADGSLEVPFVQCKLGRFTPDGSQFESLTAGPNNIWGLITSREGETFIQEANDLGYPVIPYEPGIWVATGSKDRLRSYQPLMPPLLAPAQMGGTGLSGLALAEDGDRLFRRVGAADDQAGVKVFYLANPITNAINTVRATPRGPRYGYEKLPDFITTDDKWFRPVAMHFGPDGALYIVDWYNKIISHNEVPRSHPDRDKARGRIWRVRHRDQPRLVPPDLTRLDDGGLLAQLGGPNALVSRLAWLEIIDRKAAGVATELSRLAGDRSVAIDRRLAALWALEGLQFVPTELLTSLVSDPSPNVRHEVARIAAAQARPEAEFLALATPLVGDAHSSVRAAIGDSLRRVRGASARVMLLAARLGAGALTSGDAFDRYDREFERYLARWAMELNPGATAALLQSPEGRALPLENRVLATLALGGKDAAIGLARLTPELQRPAGDEEVRALASNVSEPAVGEALNRALAQAATREPVVRSLLALRTSLDTSQLTAALTEAARALLSSADAAETALGAQLAGAFRLGALEPELTAVLTQGGSIGPLSPAALAALRALRENGGGPVAFFEALVRGGADPVVRDLALAGLAAKGTPDASARLVQLLPALTTSQRGNALERLAGHASGAAAIGAGLRAGAVANADVGVGTAEKLRTLLPADPAVAALWHSLGGDAQRVLRLPGGVADYPDTQIALSGPFTIEAWLKLDPEINWRDGLLGASGQLDLNFLEGRLRVWLSEASDIAVATKPAVPGAWTHYAVTRDRDGTFRIYLNGELDTTSTGTSLTPLSGLNLGRSRANPATSGTTAGWLAEYRVWNVARSPQEIRENFDRSFAGPTSARPAALTHLFTGANWGPLNGAARSEVADDAPELLTAAAAAAQEEKFARFRALADARGNAARGQALFAALCLTCHQHGGKGGQIAPALDGVGNIGVEAILRNVLTPSAAMESAYRAYRVVLKNGTGHEGFLADEDATAVVLRTPGAEDRRLAKTEINTAGYLRRSLMPDGLLESLPPESVSDLFAYLKALK